MTIIQQEEHYCFSLASITFFKTRLEEAINDLWLDYLYLSCIELNRNTVIATSCNWLFQIDSYEN